MENTNLIQFLANAAMLCSAIFIPLMATQYGAGPIMVGVIVGIYYLFFMVSNYLFGLLSDRYGGRLFLQLGLIAAAVLFALQVLARDLSSLFWLRALAGLSAGIFPAVLAVYAYTEHGGRMGAFTGYGSLGWGIGAVIAGFVSNNNTIFLLSSIFFAVAFLLSFQMKGRFEQTQNISLIPWRLFRKNSRIYIPFFLRALGAQAIWSIFPLYLVLTGADNTWIGIAYFINLCSQFFLMQYAERFKNLHLINVGLLCSVLTFIGYALFPHLPVVIALQLLLSVSFSALSVGSVQEIMAKNNERSSAIGLLNSIGNFTAVVGPFTAGFIAQSYGYQGVMWFGAILSFAGLVSFTSVLE